MSKTAPKMLCRTIFQKLKDFSRDSKGRFLLRGPKRFYSIQNLNFSECMQRWQNKDHCPVLLCILKLPRAKHEHDEGLSDQIWPVCGYLRTPEMKLFKILDKAKIKINKDMQRCHPNKELNHRYSTTHSTPFCSTFHLRLHALQ